MTADPLRHHPVSDMMGKTRQLLMLETPVARHRSSDEVDVVLSIAAVGPLVVY